MTYYAYTVFLYKQYPTEINKKLKQKQQHVRLNFFYLKTICFHLRFHCIASGGNREKNNSAYSKNLFKRDCMVKRDCMINYNQKNYNKE